MADIELLTEHFGYPPVSLLDDIVNSVNILAERALNSVEQGLLNAPPASIGFKSKPPPNHPSSASQPWIPSEAAKNEIELGTHQLETLLCASIDRNLDKFELFVLRNFLCVQPVDIRDWMRLSHYEGLDFSELPSPEDTAAASGGQNGNSDTPTLDSINALRRRLRESMRLNALLTAERERNARTLQKLQHLIVGGKLGVKAEGGNDDRTSAALGAHNANTPAPTTSAEKQNGDDAEKHGPSPFAFLQQKGTLSAAGGSTPLSTTTAFTLSQLQALRALSQSLTNVTPDLLAPLPDETSGSQRDPDTKMGEDEDDWHSKSWRRQRTEYVEHATRRHLEIVHGLEFGKEGEVRDGEWQGEGRKLAHGEVEGLEHVVTVLEREAAANPRPPRKQKQVQLPQQQQKKKKQVQVRIDEDEEVSEPQPAAAAAAQRTPAGKGTANKSGNSHANGSRVGEAQQQQQQQEQQQQEEEEQDDYDGPDENSVPVIPVRGAGGVRKPASSSLLTTPKARALASATPTSRTRGKSTTTPAGGRTPSMNSAQRSARTTGRRKSATPVREEEEEDLMDMS